MKFWSWLSFSFHGNRKLTMPTEAQCQSINEEERQKFVPVRHFYLGSPQLMTWRCTAGDSGQILWLCLLLYLVQWYHSVRCKHTEMCSLFVVDKRQQEAKSRFLPIHPKYCLRKHKCRESRKKWNNSVDLQLLCILIYWVWFIQSDCSAFPPFQFVKHFNKSQIPLIWLYLIEFLFWKHFPSFLRNTQ